MEERAVHPARSSISIRFCSQFEGKEPGMNIGDKITWAYRLLFILMLIWLRFIEQYISIWGVWVVWAIIIIFWLFNPFKKRKPQPTASQTDQPQLINVK